MDTGGIVPRRRVRVALGLVALVSSATISACTGGERKGDDDDDNGTPTPPATLTVDYVFPLSPDPLAGIGAWRVTLTSAGTTVASGEFADGEPVELRVDPLSNARLILEGCVPAGCASGVLSRGRTVTFDVTGSEQTIPMWFGRVATFSTPHGAYLARVEPAVQRLPGGRVLLAGGFAAGTPVVNVDVYDEATDTLWAGPALPLAIAGGAAVRLDDETLLLAGGRSGAGASDQAMVFTYAPAGTGSWTVAAPMGQTRNGPMGAPLGRRRALLAGGKDGNNMRASTEAFRWDGVLGSWEAGADLAFPLIGAVAVQVGTNAVLVGGGVSTEMGVDDVKSNVALFQSDGTNGWTRMNAGAFTRTRGQSAVVEIAPNDWLIAGGLTGGMPPFDPTRATERLTWDGVVATTSASGLADVAVKSGGGGLSGDGRYLLLGGDTAGLGGADAPSGQALVYDPVTGDFTALGASPGATTHSTVLPLADGTTLVVTDLGVFRFNP